MKLERIKPDDKVFYKGEYDTLDEKSQEKFLKQYSRQPVDNNWKIQDRTELEEQVKSGELIYVENYIFWCIQCLYNIDYLDYYI